MGGTTITNIIGRGYSWPFNRVCKCLKTTSTDPVWDAMYHGDDYWRLTTPGTCNTWPGLGYDHAPQQLYYQACFAHDICLMEISGNAHLACAYLLGSGIQALMNTYW